MKSKPSVLLARRLSDVADCHFKIEHKKGTDNILADCNKSDEINAKTEVEWISSDYNQPNKRER